jgi:hypothetical protein
MLDAERIDGPKRETVKLIQKSDRLHRRSHAYPFLSSRIITWI